MWALATAVPLDRQKHPSPNLPLKKLFTKKKPHNVRGVSSILHGDFLRIVAQERASQIPLRNYSEKMGEASADIWFWWKGYVQSSIHLYRRLLLVKRSKCFINKFSDFIHIKYKKLGAHNYFPKMFICSANFLWAQSAFFLISTLNSFQSILMITAGVSDLTLAGSHGKGHFLLLLSQDYPSTSKAAAWEASFYFSM